MNLDEKLRWKYAYKGDFHQKFASMMESIKELDDLIAEGIFDFDCQKRFFKSFKKLFDGAIKTLMHYFRYQGIFQVDPFEIIKEAFYVEIIEEGQTWVNMLFDVNEWAKNNYEKLDIKDRLKIKEEYLPELEKLDKFLAEECEAV